MQHEDLSSGAYEPVIHRRRRGLTLAVAVIAAASLLATACGSASEDDTGSAEQGASSTDFTIAPEGEPTPGGKIIYGIEAETDGFNPTANRWAIAGHMVAQAVFDPLAAMDADGAAQPYLAESFTPNDDYTSWTIALREGVTFHDGTPLNADAVVATIEGHRESPLTGSAVEPISSVTAVDDLTVEITTKIPWVALPAGLTGQVGYIVAPVMLDPATSEAAARAPVGTGPFKLVEWVPNQRWVGEKYTDYWQEGLPYLDGVEFRPIPQVNSRQQAFNTGELQMMHTSDPVTISELRTAAANEELQLVEDRGEGEESMILLNLDNEPLNDIRVRQALAYATDTETYNQVINNGASVVARNLFTPNSPWVVETDYPSFDQAKAQELIDDYIADPTTPNEVRFTLTTTPTPETQRAVSTLQQQWAQVGITVDLNTVEQAAFISTAITSEFDANLWRQFGAPDPDVDLVWFYSGGENGNILNFSNMNDAQIDEALITGRSNPDPEARKQAYGDFQRRMAELIPYIWLSHTQWVVAANNNVRGIGNGVLPDGQPAYPLGGVGTFGGVHRLTQTWLVQ
jgi:peptide/nickel transport system substrate-binding protein